MDLRYSESDEAFRAELKEWLARVLPDLPPRPGRADWDARRRFDTDWQRRLFDAGYAGLSWPVWLPRLTIPSMILTQGRLAPTFVRLR